MSNDIATAKLPSTTKVWTAFKITMRLNGRKVVEWTRFGADKEDAGKSALAAAYKEYPDKKVTLESVEPTTVPTLNNQSSKAV